MHLNQNWLYFEYKRIQSNIESLRIWKFENLKFEFGSRSLPIAYLLSEFNKFIQVIKFDRQKEARNWFFRKETFPSRTFGTFRLFWDFSDIKSGLLSSKEDCKTCIADFYWLGFATSMMNFRRKKM